MVFSIESFIGIAEKLKILDSLGSVFMVFVTLYKVVDDTKNVVQRYFSNNIR